MNTADAHARLASLLAAREWRGRVIRADHVEQMHMLLDGFRDSGLFNSDFYDLELADSFEWEPPAELPEPRSVIVLARPAPTVRLVFRWRGRDREVIIPPTYRGFRIARAEMLDAVRASLAAGGFGVHSAHLPEKSFAVRSGLARYGRNNVAYVRGLGSHAQIAAAWSDLPALDDTWGEPAVLERCATCRACADACPTDAIGKFRFLLHGERCLTHSNKRPGVFPEWIPREAHNALVGCMRCQEVCPENRAAAEAATEQAAGVGPGVRAAWTMDAGPSFSEDETTLLLDGTPREDLCAATVAKLDSLDAFMEHELICRNLAALLAP